MAVVGVGPVRHGGRRQRSSPFAAIRPVHCPDTTWGESMAGKLRRSRQASAGASLALVLLGLAGCAATSSPSAPPSSPSDVASPVPAQTPPQSRSAPPSPTSEQPTASPTPDFVSISATDVVLSKSSDEGGPLTRVDVTITNMAPDLYAAVELVYEVTIDGKPVTADDPRWLGAGPASLLVGPAGEQGVSVFLRSDAEPVSASPRLTNVQFFSGPKTLGTWTGQFVTDSFNVTYEDDETTNWYWMIGISSPGSPESPAFGVLWECGTPVSKTQKLPLTPAQLELIPLGAVMHGGGVRCGEQPWLVRSPAP